MDENAEKIHKLLLPLLLECKKVCEKNDIWYSLAYGSVLGAVRHNGFIPWDLDADVFLLLPDKQRFREAFAADDHGEILLKNCETTPRCTQSHDSLIYKNPKIKVHLDLYPLVGAPSLEKERDKFTFWSYYLDRIIRSKYTDIRKCKPKNRLMVLGSKILTILIPDDFLKKNIYYRENMVPFSDAKYLTDLGCDNRSKGCIPREIMLDVVDHEFEGELFKIPRRYDEYLRRTYGDDYMTPKKY